MEQIFEINLFIWKFWSVPPILAREAAHTSQTEVDALRIERDATRDERDARAAELMELRKPPPPPARDPDGVYQHGVKVGVVVLPQVDLGQSAVFFQEIRSGADFDSDAEFEYRDFRLTKASVQSIAEAIMAGQTNKSFRGVACRVVGRR